MDLLVQGGQLLLSLSLLIVLHEFGHFLPARLFGTRVEKFYLFFDWKFSLIKWKHGETEYGLGWIPLGGYVKIAGMIDESLDKEQLNSEPQSWEFRSKPAWQRLIIMIGGVTVNLLLGFFIYAMILFTWGTERLPLSSAEYGMHFDSLLVANGFQDGDKILTIGNERPYDGQDFTKKLLLGDSRKVEVERSGQRVSIVLPNDFPEQVIEQNKRGPLVFPRFPGVISDVIKGYPAEKAGFKAGDKIERINGKEVPFWMDINQAIKSSGGKTLVIDVVGADGGPRSLTVTPNSESTIGIYPKGPEELLKTEKQTYTFFAALPAGVRFGVDVLSGYVAQFKLVFTKAGIKQVGGFGTMGKLFDKTWDWNTFWERTALISIILAFMNILPIPALDGGHILFLLWEMISGKPAPEKVLEYAQYVGMALLLTLMVYANGNDIFRSFFQ
ncbi:MAG TPA: RIP metalloprotease RseP [Luteibaculaceae bacterium]|nr:RIP metalloprotease RseP [Luteibaculaceae bacterium]